MGLKEKQEERETYEDVKEIVVENQRLPSEAVSKVPSDHASKETADSKHAHNGAPQSYSDIKKKKERERKK